MMQAGLNSLKQGPTAYTWQMFIERTDVIERLTIDERVIRQQ